MVSMIGLLWRDDDSKRELISKIEIAASRYFAKYGHAPTVCYAHPSAFDGSELRPGDVVNHPEQGEIKVLGAVYVQPNHFWLVEMTKPKENAKSD